MLQRSLRAPLSLACHIPLRLPPRSRLAWTFSDRVFHQDRQFHLRSRLLSPSAENSTSTSQASESPPSSTEKPAQNETLEDPLKTKVESQEREIIDLKDKYLRSVADFRNLQERTKRDISSARDFAISKFAKDLIDSVDNLDRALSTVPAGAVAPAASEGAPAPNQDLVNLHDGLKMTERVMMQTLAKHGLERYDPAEKEERFDPNLHEASFMAPMQGKEDGAIFTTIQKGFSLNGRIIRAAKVGVVKNS